VFVTARPLGTRLFDFADPVNVLDGRALMLRQQPTLGETLAQETGVKSTYFGPNASRPVIRGLGGFDIRILNNGIGVWDASAASPDHAVAVSPFAVERIEVVRGPATVMYGGSAIGGVVNTIDSRIAETPPMRPVRGAAGYRFDSASDLSAGGARVAVGNERLAFHVDGYRSRNNELRIPGDAWTGAVQDERGEPGPSGRLLNSQGDSTTWGAGLTTFLPNSGHLGVSYGRFETDYGTVAEPGVTIRLAQDTWNLSSEIGSVPGLEALRLKVGYNDYTHTEFEGGEAATVFDSTAWNLRLEALHRPLGPFAGAVGIEAVDVDFSAEGAEAFLPSTKTQGFGAFLYEETQSGPWRLSFGGRVDRTEVDADAFVVRDQPSDSRNFTTWNGALGASYIVDAWSIGSNLQVTQRAPTSQELFANGPHLATGQFEVGDRNLDKVRATSIDVALRYAHRGVRATLAAFYANYSNFIGLFPTGVVRLPDGTIVTDASARLKQEEEEKEEEPLPEFVFRGVKARFYGFEAEATLPVWQSGSDIVSLKLSFDMVRADDRDSDQPLPFIPPLRFGTAFNWEREGWAASVGGSFARRQDRVPEFQTTTPGYVDVFVSAAYRWRLGTHSEVEAFVQGRNLLDQTIRYSTSSLKDIAPAGARAVIAGVRATF
jgi:iron complex outermembrane receptor protein